MIEIKEVTEIVKSVLSVNRNIGDIDVNSPLTGAPILANSREIVYIVMELMEKYDIIFDAEDFEDYKFNTITGIVNAVNRHLVNENG